MRADKARPPARFDQDYDMGLFERPVQSTHPSIQRQQQINRMGSPGLQMTFPGTAEAVRQALRDILADKIFLAYPEDLVVNAEIVLAEVMNNIVEHAYADRGGDIAVQLTQSPKGLACRLTDHGRAMPSLQLPEGSFQPLGDVSDLPEGGFGWFLIRTLVDDLSYSRVENENCVSFLLLAEHSSLK